MESWGAIVECENVESYEHHVEAFNVCSPWLIFTKYVISYWLNPHKEKFVKAWTDKVMHLGNTTSNKVEAVHWSLKRILETSMGDLCFCWDSMNKMIILQHNAIKSSFACEESDRIEYVGLDKSRCGCTIISTHGLPCACELTSFSVGSIPLQSVHFIWTRLSFLDISSGDTSTELSIKPEWVAIMNRFNEVDMAGKINIKAKLREIAYPDKTSLCPPREKVKTKGAQKQGIYFGDSSDQINSNPYIVDNIDVKASGHCGYRAVGALLGMGEESWAIISTDKWMTIPDMGYVIANQHNVC
ncbi:uncharacterized protein [Phaseolus vulgaris]|uniref:uncharacterized protein n=1 Tax=Phaseolus vulgaris TaxID=3885 RepID=UPI0035CC30D1